MLDFAPPLGKKEAEMAMRKEAPPPVLGEETTVQEQPRLVVVPEQRVKKTSKLPWILGVAGIVAVLAVVAVAMTVLGDRGSEAAPAQTGETGIVPGQQEPAAPAQNPPGPAVQNPPAQSQEEVLPFNPPVPDGSAIPYQSEPASSPQSGVETFNSFLLYLSRGEEEQALKFVADKNEESILGFLALFKENKETLAVGPESPLELRGQLFRNGQEITDPTLGYSIMPGREYEVRTEYTLVMPPLRAYMRVEGDKWVITRFEDF